MEVAYVVPAKSAFDIEVASASFLYKYERLFLLGYESALNAERALDDCYSETGVCLEIVDDNCIPSEVASLVDIKRKIIQIRESDFEIIGNSGFVRMSVSHEIGHAVEHLNYFETEAKLFRTMSNAVVPYRSSEWQARVFGSALLMPFPRVVSLLDFNPEASDEDLIKIMSETFIVSLPAARARLLTIRKYKRKGIYQRLLDHFEDYDNGYEDIEEFMDID